MILIIGGRAAGKRKIVLERFGMQAQTISPEAAFMAPCIDQFHQLLRQVMEAGNDPVHFTDELMRRNPDAIILCDEIGLGIVPIDKQERLWREAVGRCCQQIAARAQQVIRVVCGLEQQLK